MIGSMPFWVIQYGNSAQIQQCIKAKFRTVDKCRSALDPSIKQFLASPSVKRFGNPVKDYINFGCKPFADFKPCERLHILWV
jgi:hypothetical protein